MSQVVGLAGRHVTLSIKGDEVVITEAAAATAEAHQQPGSESSNLAMAQASNQQSTCLPALCCVLVEGVSRHVATRVASVQVDWL